MGEGDRQIKKGTVKHIIAIVLLTLLGIAVLADTVIGGNILFYSVGKSQYGLVKNGTRRACHDVFSPPR